MSPEKKQPEIIPSPDPFRQVRLEHDVLVDLVLRTRYAKAKGTEGAFVRLKGALNIPRSHLAQNAHLVDLVEKLQTSGRAIGEEIVPRRAFFPALAGNLVLRPQADFPPGLESVAQATLLSVLDFFQQDPDTVSAITVLPNASANQQKLNGVVVDFTTQKRWWRELTKRSWSLGRGLLVARLPMDFDQFCQESHQLLEGVFQTARSVAGLQGLKYVHFANDLQGQIYIVLAGGPNKVEAAGINQQLADDIREREVTEHMETVTGQMIDRRLETAGILLEQFGFSQPDFDVVFNQPYIGLDPGTNRAWSGGTNGVSGLNPLMPNISAIDLIPSKGGSEIIPLGDRLHLPESGFMPQLPPGVLGLGIENKPTQPTLLLEQQNMSGAQTLDVLAVCFHGRMQMKRKEK